MVEAVENDSSDGKFGFAYFILTTFVVESVSE
jgi:hypothetical protein